MMYTSPSMQDWRILFHGVKGRLTDSGQHWYSLASFLVLVSEASPHWGGGWKTLYCRACPYLVVCRYIYIICRTFIPGEHIEDFTD